MQLDSDLGKSVSGSRRRVDILLLGLGFQTVHLKAVEGSL